LGILFELMILYLSGAGIPTGVPVTRFGFVGGTPAVEVGQEFIPDEGESEVKKIPFDQLPPGKITLSGDPGVKDAPQLNHIVKAIYEDMEHRKENADPQGRKMSPEASGNVDIVQIQPDLKSFTINISYTDEEGKPQTFSKTAYIHADSAY